MESVPESGHPATGATVARRLKPGWIAWAFLLAGLCVAAFAYWQGTVLVRQELASRLDLRAREAKYTLEREVNGYAEVLRGLQAQFVANPYMSRRTFQQISQSLDLDHRLPGVQAVAFTQRIAPGEARAFEDAARLELAGDTLGYPPPAIHPSPGASPADDFVVQYTEPIATNRAGAWFNQGSEPRRRAAIERARDTGEWSNSGRLLLSVAPNKVEGVIFFLPVYQGGTTPPTVEQRRAQFLGTVFLVIRIDDMMRHVFGPALLQDLDIDIYDMQDNTATAHGADNLIFDSGRVPGEARHVDYSAATARRAFDISLGGGLWHLTTAPLPAFASQSQDWLPAIVALAGVLLSLLMFSVMRSLELSRLALDAHARDVEHALDTKDKQLTRITESIDAVLWTLDLPGAEIRYISPAVARVYGRPVEAFYSDPRLWLACVHPDDRNLLRAIPGIIVNSGRETLEYRIIRPDGEVRWVRCETHYLAGNAPGTGCIDGIGSDITEQRRLDQALRRSHRALRARHECEQVIARAENETALLQGICDVVVQAGYCMAWAGILRQDGGPRVEPVGAAGERLEYLDCIEHLLTAGELEALPTIGEALRTRSPMVANQFDRDLERFPWRAEAARCGFRSKIALPLFHEQSMMGLLNVYALEQEAFDAEAVELLMDLAQSISVAVQAHRHRSGRQAAEASSHLRERAIEACANAIIITSAQAPDYPIEYVNSAFERMTGYAAAEVIGRNLRLLHNEDQEQPGLREIRAIFTEQRAGHATLHNFRKDGTPYWSEIYIAPVKDEAGRVGHFVAAEYDITATKHYETELEFQASRDMLTGLANRNLLLDRLSQAIAFAVRYGDPIWVVFLNLDRFKLINETLGLGAGDALLRQVAGRLQGAVRDTDTVARLAGDEFVLVLPKRADEMLTTTVVQRIMTEIEQPLAVDGRDVFLTCSIGVAAYPSDGGDAETLIKHAHIAMYRAKETGANTFQFFTAAMNEHAFERLRIENDLRSALERGEFLLHYQPQVDLRSGEIVGIESLIRWRHPELGMVSPARFIGLAEETGLIVPIGAWVLRTACRQNKAWQDAGLPPVRVAVNLSARQFVQRDLVQSIAAVLDETGLDPQYLDIELTESLVMTDVERAVGILRDLKALGVCLSVDDFGTGYSSLSYLKRFPIDVLKIDQSFVRDITVDPDDAAIVSSIMSLARGLRLEVIAEGVETEDQLVYLRRHDCDRMQGYYFSRPVEAEAFEAMLRQAKRLPLAA